jgi:hypothetical protein
MSDLDTVLHGLAIKKAADANEVARAVDMDPDRSRELLDYAVAQGRAVHMKGKYLLSPLTQMALLGNYSLIYADLRKSASFMAAYGDFERINLQLKALITEWQTIEVGGRKIANDHSNRDHDMKIISRLGDLHERADVILAALSRELPRLNAYKKDLLQALERAEDGDVQWVSNAKIASYHTLWFELHEDLLRIVGKSREE